MSDDDRWISTLELTDQVRRSSEHFDALRFRCTVYGDEQDQRLRALVSEFQSSANELSFQIPFAPIYMGVYASRIFGHDIQR